MKDGYRYKNGRVVVVDYCDGAIVEEERDYQDNLDELLVAENIREYLTTMKNKMLDVIRLTKETDPDALVGGILNGSMLVTDAIDVELKKNEIELERLLSDSRKDREDSIKNNSGYIKLGGVDRIEKIDRYLTLVCCVGMNEEEYLRYQEQGTLDVELSKEFDEEDVKVLKRILVDRKNKK